MSQQKFFTKPQHPSQQLDVDAVAHLLNFLTAAELIASRILKDGVSQTLLQMSSIHLRRSRHTIKKAMEGCEKALAKIASTKPTLSR